MKIDDKIRIIIDMLNDVIQYDDLEKVHDAVKELEYIYEQISSTGFNDDEWDDCYTN